MYILYIILFELKKQLYQTYNKHINKTAMKGKVILFSLLGGLLGGLLGAILLQFFWNSDVFLNKAPQGVGASAFSVNTAVRSQGRSLMPTPLHDSLYEANTSSEQTQAVAGSVDLVAAAASSKESVVFIRTISEAEYRNGDWFSWFYGKPSRKTSTGSGVLFQADGYVVTNDHVIADAELIEVIHNNRTYGAKLIGKDPSTDLAILKLREADIAKNHMKGKLKPIVWGNSDALQIGEWVLAVGNPFNLTSTVTSGIVSAKGRDINLLKGRFPIESFIQTDAAINPGNSGGALVNSQGQLVGINTAIFSLTGSYAGYGFAVPANLVRKVAHDLIEYGLVQRAFLGMTVQAVNSRTIETLGTDVRAAIFVQAVQNEGAAQEAGLQIGDLIVSANGKTVDSKATLEEIVGNSYPGQELILQIIRDNQALPKRLTLLNKQGDTRILTSKSYTLANYGVTLEALSKVEQQALNITHGVKILRTTKRSTFRQFPTGFIITHINNIAVKTPQEVERLLKKYRRVVFRGYTADGKPLIIS